jgi:DNA mismatch repair protein MutS
VWAFDRLSIAWATLEHLHEVNRCRTLFATHCHELTALAAKLPALVCHTMRVKEWKGDVIFLHEVGPGTRRPAPTASMSPSSLAYRSP